MNLCLGKFPTLVILPFGCLVTILNTSDRLGKFEGKADKGFIVGYAAHSTTVNAASDMVESSSDYAAKLARLQKQAYDANATAEKHLSQADIATSRNGVPAGKVVPAADVSAGHSDTISTP
ncbi:hypothetical protein Tco_0648731 [Tanacetum coccineum]